jgi:hypothetical protein
MIITPLHNKKKKVHIILDESQNNECHKSPRLNPFPPSHLHLLTSPTPTEANAAPHIIPPDLPQVINHVREMCEKYPEKQHLYEQANTAVDPATGKSLECWHLIKGENRKMWATSMVNELRRLVQGVGNRIKGTNTMFFHHI